MGLYQYLSPGLPAGYRPGVLLRQVNKRDLPELVDNMEVLGKGHLYIGGTKVDVAEKVKKDFLQHTAITVFSAGNQDPKMAVKVRHKGMITRAGVEFTGDSGLADHLLGLGIEEPLTKLDFCSCEFYGTPENFGFSIATYGASEVVMRFPSMRRYISLGAAQRKNLLNTLSLLLNGQGTIDKTGGRH